MARTCHGNVTNITKFYEKKLPGRRLLNISLIWFGGCKHLQSN